MTHRNFGLNQSLSAGPYPLRHEAVPETRSHPSQVTGTSQSTSRRKTGAGPHVGPLRDKYAPREISFPPLPSGSIYAGSTPFERANAPQTVIDVVAVSYWILFALGIAAIPIGFFFLLVK